jgi:hypothetical protein
MKKTALLLIAACCGLFGCAVYETPPYHHDAPYGGEFRGDHDHDHDWHRDDRDHGDRDHRGSDDHPDHEHDWR